MSRFLQLHLLTFYPPSNPNRDDTNRPKTATVGGVERLRISSQSLKRAVRQSAAFRDGVAGHMGARTQRLGEEVRKHLAGKGLDEAEALEVARAIAAAFGKNADAKGKNPAFTEQLAFVSPSERDAAFALADAAAAGQTLPDVDGIRAQVLRKADAAADIAMFGRMLAASPDYNREAAVQVAHAITTHAVAVEDDFYTAVDDLKTSSEDMGAGFMGALGFGSGVFYIYACVNTALLRDNLGDDEAIARAATGALIEALAVSSPDGKKASFAHGGRAHFLMAERGDQQPRSLASAFVRPVSGQDLMRDSIATLLDVCARMDSAYGACAQGRRVMNVEAGEGSLADVIAFATE